MKLGPVRQGPQVLYRVALSMILFPRDLRVCLVLKWKGTPVRSGVSFTSSPNVRRPIIVHPESFCLHLTYSSC